MVLPLALPMSWMERPPYFMSVTETAFDLLNTSLQRWHLSSPHHMESLAATLPANIASPPTFAKVAPSLACWGLAASRAPPLTYGDVYVDNFIFSAQTKRHRQRVMGSALHAIDQVLRPLAASDCPSCEERITV